MNDLFPIPDTWRDELVTYPSEVVFTVLAVTTFGFLLLLAKRPRVVLRGVVALAIVAAGLVAGIFGTRTGVWAERSGERGTAIVAGIVVVALVFALRLRSTVKRIFAHRRLVRDVKDDPQKLLVLALAPEITENARRSAVKLLEDPFTLDEISRRSRSSSVKKLARRRLAHTRSRTRGGHAQNPERVHDVTDVAADPTAGGSVGLGADAAAEISPESFYLPPDER